MGDARRARAGVSIVFAVCGAAFATWAARVPEVQQRLGLTPGRLAVGLFGLASGSVAALLVAGPLVTLIGSRRASPAGALVSAPGFGPDVGPGHGALALPSRRLIPLGVIAFLGFLAEGTVNDWSAVLLTTGAAPPVASLGYLAFSVSMIAVRLVADRATGRIGLVALTRISAALIVSGFVLAVAADGPAFGIIAFAVIGLGVSAVVPVAWSSAATMQPGAPGRAIAAVATLGYLGFLVGPILVGALAATIGLAPAVLVVGSLAAVVVFLAPSLRAGPVVDPAAGGGQRPK